MGMTDILRDYRHTSHNFMVFIGPNKMGFSKISNIGEEKEFETLAEGGLNDRVHYLKSPRTKRETLTMERGVATATSNMTKALEFAVGYRLGERILVPILIMVKTEDSLIPTGEFKTYSVSDAIVTKWQLGDFDASTGSVLIEKFEISHSGVTAVL